MNVQARTPIAVSSEIRLPIQAGFDARGRRISPAHILTPCGRSSGRRAEMAGALILDCGLRRCLLCDRCARAGLPG